MTRHDRTYTPAFVVWLAIVFLYAAVGTGTIAYLVASWVLARLLGTP